MEFTGQVAVLQVMSGPGSEAFNYYFTIVVFWGIVTFFFSMLFKLASRS